jgi:hypothetical protein
VDRTGTGPDIDRRELLEATALGGLPQAVADVERAWGRASGGRAMDPDVAVVTRDVTESLLSAGLTYFVQSGLRARDRQRLVRQLRYVSHRLNVLEYVRTVRLVGVETLLRHLDHEIAEMAESALTRGEQLALRSSAERVAMIVTGTKADEPPARIDVLRRLQSTGFDLR